jgi:hypothetical protein
MVVHLLLHCTAVHPSESVQIICSVTINLQGKEKCMEWLIKIKLDMQAQRCSRTTYHKSPLQRQVRHAWNKHVNPLGQELNAQWQRENWKLNDTCIRNAIKLHHLSLKFSILSITLHDGYT